MILPNGHDDLVLRDLLYGDNEDTIFVSEFNDEVIGIELVGRRKFYTETAYRKLRAERDRLLEAYKVLKELQECSYYWSEYDVPIGIHERIDKAVSGVEAIYEGKDESVEA